MKKINKKGFTLVELLAVIVVLALIMVFAIPTVLDASGKAHKETFSLYAEKTFIQAKTYFALYPEKTCATLKDIGMPGNEYTGKIFWDDTDKVYKLFLHDETYYFSSKTLEQVKEGNSISSFADASEDTITFVKNSAAACN